MLHMQQMAAYLDVLRIITAHSKFPNLSVCVCGGGGGEGGGGYKAMYME